MANYEWVFTLNIMNISLGIMVLVPILIMGYGAASEVLHWVKNHRGGKRKVRKQPVISGNEFAIFCA
jgi:hypothetical protein